MWRGDVLSWFEFDLHCLGWHIVDILHKKRCMCRLSVAGHRWMHTVHSLCRCLFEIQQWTRGWSWVCSDRIKDRLHTWWPLWMGTRTCNFQPRWMTFTVRTGMSNSMQQQVMILWWRIQVWMTLNDQHIILSDMFEDNPLLCRKVSGCFYLSGPPPKPPPGNSAIASILGS